jgi:glycerol-3-phosphate acyltransferase PlsY
VCSATAPQPEWPRRLFHALGAITIALVGLAMPWSLFVPLLILAAASFVTVDLVRFKHSRLNRWYVKRLRPFIRTTEVSRITGASYMAIAAAVAFLSFDPIVAALSLCFLGAGDPVSGIIGCRPGTRLLGNKTVESSLGCFAACLVPAVLFNLFGGVPLLFGVAGAVVATVVEALPLPVNDNITVPLMSGGLVALLMLL